MFHVDERQLAGIALKGVIRCKNPRTSSRTITIEDDCEQRKRADEDYIFSPSDLEERFFVRSCVNRNRPRPGKLCPFSFRANSVTGSGEFLWVNPVVGASNIMAG
jgi:hypothetical protein